MVLLAVSETLRIDRSLISGSRVLMIYPLTRSCPRFVMVLINILMNSQSQSELRPARSHASLFHVVQK